MNIKKRRQTRMALLIFAGATLAGCAAPPKPLYQWERYQPQVYDYFKGQAPEAQISALEEDLQKIKATGSQPPPGYHAQLGLLYSQVGNYDRVAQELAVEKDLYPESAVYMDFLLKKLIK